MVSASAKKHKSFAQGASYTGKTVTASGRREMSRSLQIVTLGVLGAHVGDTEISLGGRKQRALLGRLIVAYPGGVHASQLVQAVWRDSPPRAYASSLQAY